MNIPSYIREVRAELSKVKWPTRRQAIRMTVIVIAASLLVGLYVGGLDLLFTQLLGLILR